MLSDLKDYPVDRDVYDCIRRIRAKPFDVDFDVQVEAAKALYGLQLKLPFSRADVSRTLDSVRALYSNPVMSRVEQTLYEQMQRYPIYF